MLARRYYVHRIEVLEAALGAARSTPSDAHLRLTVTGWGGIPRGPLPVLATYSAAFLPTMILT
jgi:hypothetical protein